MTSKQRSAASAHPKDNTHSSSNAQSTSAIRPVLPALSSNSTAAVPTSLWSSEDFMLGAGAVIIQPSTQRVCILEEGGRYFLPRGRKDVGESLEQAALREAHEESGYRASFLPALHLVLQPRAPASGSASATAITPFDHPDMTTEAFYVSLRPFTRRPRRARPANTGAEYLVFWYLCQIGPDAVPDEGTRMPDEQNYLTHLLPYEDALKTMSDCGDIWEAAVLQRAISIWLETEKLLDEARQNQQDSTARMSR